MNTGSIIFEKGDLNDLENICLVNHTIFKKMYASEPYSLEVYKERVEDKEVFINLIKNKGELMGDSIAFKEEKKLYIWILGIIEDYRKRGLGSKLLQINEKYAKTQGLSTISVKVYEASKEMIDLLKKNEYGIERIENGGVVYFDKNLK